MPFYRDNPKTGIRQEIDNFAVGIALFHTFVLGFVVGCVLILSLS